MSENGKKEVSYETQMTLKKAVEFLEALVSGLKAGRVCVQQGHESVTVRPEKVVNLEIEAREKKEREALGFKLTWRKPIAAEEDTDLKISSEEPLPEAEEEALAGKSTG